jgi:hypothetical protein
MENKNLAELIVHFIKNEVKIEDLPQTLSMLREQAAKVGYRNQLPRIPKKHKVAKVQSEIVQSTMRGFYGRLQNWVKGLAQLEEQAAHQLA